MAWKQWSGEDNKKFEEALALTENDPNRFETIANYLQKPLEVVKYYYDALVHDIELIESGRYDDTTGYQDYEDGLSSETKQYVEKDEKRGNHWTDIEHGHFLEGLATFGRGKWKDISRVHVKTRTPKQVASHAQKYFMRQSMQSEAKKRSSIFDDDAAAEDVPATRSDLDSTIVLAHFGQQIP